MSRIALIDGDVIVYAAAWAAEETEDWGDGIQAIVNKDKVAEIIDGLVCDIESDVDSDKSIVCLSDKRTFRDDLFPEYKANRRGEGKRKPLGYQVARNYFRDNFEVMKRDNLEADDVMGVMATKRSPHDYVICSVDKDMKQVPGLHYDWKHADEGVFEIDYWEADRMFWCQCLSGDSTDNIQGIPGVGPVKAAKLVDASVVDHNGWSNEQGWQDVVLPAYAAAGLTEDDALLTARLVRILQASDYDFKKKEPILWTP